jgi:hypothetical protein
VTLLTVEAVRRTRSRRAPRKVTPFIDGVRPPNTAELNARPAEEANGCGPRLVSEADDYSPMSQRW